MKYNINNSYPSSLNTPYKEFCEEFIRLAELIIQFEQEQIEVLEKAEKDELTMLIMGEKTRLSFLGENGIKKHYQMVKGRVIQESINKNVGLKKTFEMLIRLQMTHSIEVDKLGMVSQSSNAMKPYEMFINYEIAVNHLANFKVQDDIHQKK